MRSASMFLKVKVRAMKDQASPGISPGDAHVSLSIQRWRDDYAHQGAEWRERRLHQRREHPAQGGIRAQPIANWKNPVAVEDDTSWIQRVNLLVIDDETHTAIARALLPRKAPTTFIGPYLPPDGKYLVARDRDRTQNKNARITTLHPDVEVGHGVHAPAPNYISVSWSGVIGPPQVSAPTGQSRRSARTPILRMKFYHPQSISVSFIGTQTLSIAGAAYTVRSALPVSSGSGVAIAVNLKKGILLEHTHMWLTSMKKSNLALMLLFKMLKEEQKLDLSKIILEPST